MAHPLNMLSRRTVTIFSRDGQPLNRFFTREAKLLFASFEPFQGLLQRHRSGADDILQVFAVQAVFHFKASTAERISDINQNFIGFKRLDDIAKGSHLERGVCQNPTVKTSDRKST